MCFCPCTVWHIVGFLLTALFSFIYFSVSIRFCVFDPFIAQHTYSSVCFHADLLLMLFYFLCLETSFTGPYTAIGNVGTLMPLILFASFFVFDCFCCCYYYSFIMNLPPFTVGIILSNCKQSFFFLDAISWYLKTLVTG
jgi:hypothetical protein